MCAIIHTYMRKKRFHFCHLPGVCSQYTHRSAAGGQVRSCEQASLGFSHGEPTSSSSLSTHPGWSPVQPPKPLPAHPPVPRSRMARLCRVLTWDGLQVGPRGTDQSRGRCFPGSLQPVAGSGPGRASQAAPPSVPLHGHLGLHESSWELGCPVHVGC